MLMWGLGGSGGDGGVRWGGVPQGKGQVARVNMCCTRGHGHTDEILM